MRAHAHSFISFSLSFHFRFLFIFIFNFISFSLFIFISCHFIFFFIFIFISFHFHFWNFSIFYFHSQMKTKMKFTNFFNFLFLKFPDFWKKSAEFIEKKASDTRPPFLSFPKKDDFWTIFEFVNCKEGTEKDRRKIEKKSEKRALFDAFPSKREPFGNSSDLARLDRRTAPQLRPWLHALRSRMTWCMASQTPSNYLPLYYDFI